MAEGGGDDVAREFTDVTQEIELAPLTSEELTRARERAAIRRDAMIGQRMVADASSLSSPQEDVGAGSVAAERGQIESRIELSADQAQQLVAEQFRRLGEHVAEVVRCQLKEAVVEAAPAIAEEVARVAKVEAAGNADGASEPRLAAAGHQPSRPVRRCEGSAESMPRWSFVVVTVVVGVVSWWGANLHAASEYRAERERWYAALPAIKHALGTDAGRRWVEMLATNPLRSVEDIESCSSAAGLKIQRTANGGEACAGSGAVRGWHLAR